MKRCKLGGPSLAPAAEGLAQKGKKKKKGKKGDTEQVDGKKKGGKDKVKSVAEFTEDFKLDEGLFNLYQDTAKGSMYMHIPADAMDSEFIYFSQVEDGVVQSGFFRGSYRGSKVVTFHRHFGQLEVHAENTNFHVDPENALSKAADANLNTPILASLKIEAEDSTGVIVSADALFLKEELQMVKPPSRPGRKSAWASSAKPKARWWTWRTTQRTPSCRSTTCTTTATRLWAGLNLRTAATSPWVTATRCCPCLKRASRHVRTTHASDSSPQRWTT